MAYILSLDQGTTSSRALVVNEKGEVVAIAQKEFNQYFPKPGLVEHDPEEIWSSQIGVASEALAIANLDAADISAIGITNQRETTIVWDRKTGKSIYRAIVWQDRRTSQICGALKGKKLESLFNQKTGLLLDPYFSGTKIKWILDNVSGAKERAEKGELAFGTVDSWLIWNLTKGKLHITDVTNASRTLLFNIHEMKWDDELLKILEIPKSLLPEVKSSSEIYGETADPLFSVNIPIAGIAGDQQAALFGQGCFEPGMAKATFGTGAFILVNTGEKPVPSQNRLLTTIAYKIGNEVRYALEGSVFIAGAAINWVRDELGLIKKSSEIDDLACKVADTGGVYFVPAFTGLGAPHWDPQARGAIFGLSRGTTSAHIARACLEAIAFQTTDVFHALLSDAKIKLPLVRVDGGVAKSDLLMQTLSDLMEIDIHRPKLGELSALGAAFLAGLAVGIWKDKSEVASLWKLEKKFSPLIDENDRKRRTQIWNKAVDRVRNWEDEV